MSFILNALNLSDKILSFEQVIKPSFDTTITAAQRLAKVHDYGYSYDKYFSDIDLILTELEYTSLKALIGTTLTLTSDLDIFFPNTTFPANQSVGLMSLESDSWFIDDIYTHRVARLKLKLLSTITHSGTVTELQKLLNRGFVDPMDDLGVSSPDIVGVGYQMARTLPKRQFVISHNLLTPYEAKEILTYLLTLRTGKTTVTLSARHGVSGSQQVFLSEFRLSRTEDSRYALSIVVTVY